MPQGQRFTSCFLWRWWSKLLSHDQQIKGNTCRLSHLPLALWRLYGTWFYGTCATDSQFKSQEVSLCPSAHPSVTAVHGRVTRFTEGVEVEATRYFIGGAVSPHFKITVNPFVKLDNVFILPYFKVNVLYFAHVSVNCAGSQGKSCSSAQEYQYKFIIFLFFLVCHRDSIPIK